MTNKEIISLPVNTHVRVKPSRGVADCYTKKTCLLKFYDNKREGRTWVNKDDGELIIYFPWGVQSGPESNGVCYEFPADQIEKV